MKSVFIVQPTSADTIYFIAGPIADIACDFTLLFLNLFQKYVKFYICSQVIYTFELLNDPHFLHEGSAH